VGWRRGRGKREAELGWGRGKRALARSWAASARLARWELGRDARAHEGEMALGRAGGKERGRGGWGEPAEMGQGRGGGLISISPFLSLFYLFQFDIMCKLMIK
jgi:hypothetical protein